MDVLVVDDSPELLDLVRRALARDGHRVRVAVSIADARHELAALVPDLAILDIALPDGTGVELCRELRGAGMQLPILLLTAHAEIPERVAGLDAGADDFLGKPFAVAELRARVRALGRRGPLPRPTVTTIGDAAIDLAARRATKAGVEVPITAREWSVIELLIARSPRVVARATILEIVWGDAEPGASASLDVIMARIRRKLGPDVVRTVRAEGYVLGDG